MKGHTLEMIGNKTEQELISWGNEKVESYLKINSLKDKKLSNSLYFLKIMECIEPRSIQWNNAIIDQDDDKSKKNNAKYAISTARKLGATIFLSWEDIVEIKSRHLLIFLASLYEIKKNYKPIN